MHGGYCVAARALCMLIRRRREGGQLYGSQCQTCLPVVLLQGEEVGGEGGGDHDGAGGEAVRVGSE